MRHFTTEQLAFINAASILNSQHAQAAYRTGRITEPLDVSQALAHVLTTVITDDDCLEHGNHRHLLAIPHAMQTSMLVRFGPKHGETWQAALDRFEAFVARVWGTGLLE